MSDEALSTFYDIFFLNATEFFSTSILIKIDLKKHLKLSERLLG